MTCPHVEAKVLIEEHDKIEWCQRCGAVWHDGKWHLPSWLLVRPTIPTRPPNHILQSIGKMLKQQT